MRAASCETVVLGQQEVAENIMKMRVSWVDEEHAPHAGQFFMLRGWADDEAPFLSRPISLHSFDAQQESLEFLYQVKGEGTEKLSQLEELGDGKQYLVDFSLKRENPSSAENFGNSNPVQLRS